MFKSNKGFTLIELLVVIAIIGILSSVVLASLNTARSKGSDAAIKADVAGIRAAAELVYDDLGSYATTAQAWTNSCSGITVGTTNVANRAEVQKAIVDAVSKNGGNQAYCNAQAGYYWVAVPLKSDSTKGWCVDSSGNSKQVTMSAMTNSVTACQ